jgi:acyl-coenzyme A synthetase/AMP-(fatty) acid ligase
VPRHVVGVAALPTNATGKILKDELRDRAVVDLADSQHPKQSNSGGTQCV